MIKSLFSKLLALRGKTNRELSNSPNAEEVKKNESDVSTAIGSPQELIATLEKLMEKGNYSACFDLGQLYYMGDKGVQKDIHRAVSYFKKAADNGIGVATYQLMVNLATCYEMGVGVAKDRAEAYRWYKEAAVRGDAYAQGKVDSME